MPKCVCVFYLLLVLRWVAPICELCNGVEAGRLSRLRAPFLGRVVAREAPCCVDLAELLVFRGFCIGSFWPFSLCKHGFPLCLENSEGGRVVSCGSNRVHVVSNYLRELVILVVLGLLGILVTICSILVLSIRIDAHWETEYRLGRQQVVCAAHDMATADVISNSVAVPLKVCDSSP